jgi:hypothetical protein
MEGSPTSTWRALFDRHYSVFVDEVSSRLVSELEEAVGAVAAAERDKADRQAESARRITAEALNQALRRMRQAASQSAVLELLADGTAPWADTVVVLSLGNNQARALAVRTLNAAADGIIDGLIDVDAAGAIRSAVDSKDPLVALASPAEISPALAAVFRQTGPGDAPSEPPRAYLFPVVVRQNVVAMLIASGGVTPAPLEVLSEATGMRLELLSAPAPLVPLKNPELVQIAAPSVPASSTTERRVWEELSQDDQKLHLQAQRVARVRVAELRLYNAEELRKGVFVGDIYNALRGGIDSARTEFLQSYLSKSPTMVDYLHLELLRSLAHDDDRLLGKDYPGPMV